MSQPNTDPIHIDGDSRHLKTLYRVGSMLNQVTAGLEMHRILPRVLRACVNTLEADTGSIFVLKEDLTLEHAWMIDGEKAFEDKEWPFLTQVLNDGLSGKVIEKGESILITNSLEDDRWIPSANITNHVIRSAISVPLKIHGRVNGTITISKEGLSQFNLDDLNMLSTIADQAASAISNAQLYQDSLRQAEALESLVNATALISSSLDVNKIISLVTEQIVHLIHVEACAILEWNAEQGDLIGRTLYTREDGNNHLPKQDRLRLNSSPFVQQILANPHAAQINLSRHDLEDEEKHLLHRLGLASLLIVPIEAQNETIGLAMLMDRSQMRVFKEHEISMVQTLANQAAVAVQNARLYQAAQKQLRITTLLNKASQVINSSLNLDEIMQSLLSQMNDFLNAEALSIALVDAQTNQLTFAVAEGVGSSQIIGMELPSNQGVSGWVMEHGEATMSNDPLNDPRFYKRGDERTGHPTRAIIVAPLTAKDRVLGTIQAINPIEKNHFTDSDLNLLDNLANLASSAIDNAQQFTRTQQAESRYIGLFQDNIDPIVLTNRHGHIVEVNGRAEEVLGQNRQELLALTIQDLHPNQEHVLTERRLRRIENTQSQIFTTHIDAPNSRTTFVEIYVKRLMVSASDDPQDAQLLQWLYHDVSEQFELQQMREDLTAMLFHDLQSPLGNIITSLELVSVDLPGRQSAVIGKHG